MKYRDSLIIAAITGIINAAYFYFSIRMFGASWHSILIAALSLTLVQEVIWPMLTERDDDDLDSIKRDYERLGQNIKEIEKEMNKNET